MDNLGETLLAVPSAMTCTSFFNIPSLPVTGYRSISGTAAVTHISGTGNQVSVAEPGLIATRRISIQKQ